MSKESIKIEKNAVIEAILKSGKLQPSLSPSFVGQGTVDSFKVCEPKFVLWDKDTKKCGGVIDVTEKNIKDCDTTKGFFSFTAIADVNCQESVYPAQPIRLTHETYSYLVDKQPQSFMVETKESSKILANGKPATYATVLLKEQKVK